MAVGAKANRYNFLIACFVALGSFTYGFNSAAFAGVLGLPSFYTYFTIDTTTSHGSAILGAVNGVYLAGGAIGCWSLAWLADLFGRRICIQVICVICIVSAALQCGSVHIAMLLVGRLINGFGVGMINSIVPTYQSEISPARQRGRLVGLHGTLLVAGYSCAGWVAFGNYFETNATIQWRLPLALQIVAPLLLATGSSWLPESPRWLVAHDRNEEALKVLEDLHRTSTDPQATGAHVEYRQIKSQLDLEARENIDSMIKLWKQPSLRRRMLTGFCVEWLLQSTGILVIFNYQTFLYKNLGVTGWVPLLLLSLYNLLATFYNFINSLLLDRLGRVRIMTIGLCGCIVIMSCFTAMVASFAGTTKRTGNAFGVFFLFCYAVFYGGCLDASSYVYISEIFPTAIRTRGVGFSVSGLFLSNLVYNMTAPTAFDNIGWKYYLVFIIIPAAGLYPFIKYLPETKGLSLEEIAGKFGDVVALDTAHAVAEEDADIERGAKEHGVLHRELSGMDGISM